MRWIGPFLALMVAYSTTAFCFQEDAAKCDIYQTLPLSQLPPLMGEGKSSNLFRALQSDYVAYLDHLRAGGKPNAYKSRFAADQIRALLNDREQMQELNAKTHGEDTEQMISRLKQLFIDGNEGTQEKAQFALMLSDVAQRYESLYDVIRLERGQKDRYSNEFKVRVGLLLGHKFQRHPWDQGEFSSYEIAKKIISQESQMINAIRQSKKQEPLVLSEGEVSLSPAERPFPPETYMHSLSTAFLSQILLQPPLLTQTEMGSAKMIGYNHEPILMTPYRGVIDSETWANLSPWPIFPMTPDIDAPHPGHPTIRIPETTFMKTKNGAINALHTNWDWFTGLYGTSSGGIASSRNEQAATVQKLEWQIRSRYICGCRVIGTPQLSMRKSIAEIWADLAYSNQGPLKKPLNSPLRQMSFDSSRVDLSAAKTYLLGRLSNMSDDCRVLREEDERNRQRRSLTQRMANEALDDLHKPQSARREEEGTRVEEKVSAAGTRQKPQNEEERKDNDKHGPERPPWNKPPTDRPKAANDNDRDEAKIAAFVGTIAPALTLYQNSVLLQTIEMAFQSVDKELKDKDLAIIGAGGAAALQVARRINQSLMVKFPSQRTMLTQGLRRALAVLSGVGLLVEGTLVAQAEEKMKSLRDTKSYEFHFTLEGLREDMKSGQATQIAKDDPLLFAFYKALAEAMSHTFSQKT